MPANGDPRRLDQALLDTLEQRWRDQGAFIARALRPGLSDEQIDRLTDPVGIRLPQEARLWWRWHDGADPQPPGPAAEAGPGRAFLPLGLAVAECQRLRNVMEAAWGPGFGPNWKEGWLPIDANKRPTLLDCGGDHEAVVPVRSFFVEDPTAGAEGVGSLGELVLVWLQAMESGSWAYDREQNRWHYDSEKLPPQLVPTHLA